MVQEAQSPSRSSFYQGVVLTSAGTIVTIAFLFLETLIAARLVATESFGSFVLMIAVVNFLVMVIDFGCRTAVTQLIASSDPRRQAELANSTLIFRLVVVSVISVLIWLGQDLFLLVDESRTLTRYIVYIPIMLIVTSLDELFLGILQGFQAYSHMAIAQVIRSILRLGLSVLLLTVFDLGVLALIYSWIVSYAVSALYQYLYLPISKRFVYQQPLLSEILRFGFPLQLNRFLWFAASQSDILILGILAGPTSLAFYAVAARIPSALHRLAESYTSVYFPTVTTLLAEGKRKRATEILDHSLRLISLAMALVVFVAVVFSHEIIVLLFSEKYAASSFVFALLMIGFHMGFLVNLMGYTLTSAGYPGRSLAESVATTTLTIVGNLVLIPFVGFVGPAYASLIAKYVANPLSVWLLRRSGILVTVSPYVKQTALLILCSILFWWLQPAGLLYKFVLILLFIVLNISLTTISGDDISLVMPQSLLKQRLVQRVFVKERIQQ